MTALRHRYRQQEAAREKAGEAWHDTGMVFTTRYGLPVEPRKFNRSYDSRIASAGVPKITVHDARRTCGCLLVDLDVHPRIAMAILRGTRTGRCRHLVPGEPRASGRRRSARPA